MLIVLVFLELLRSLEDALAVTACMPMLSLLMLQTLPTSVSGPTSKAPATFYLISMIATVIEMISHPIVVKGTTTAGWHSEQNYVEEMAILWTKQSCCEERTREMGTDMESDGQSGADAAEVTEGGTSNDEPSSRFPYLGKQERGGLGKLSHPLLTLSSGPPSPLCTNCINFEGH